jgi:hypothetical protein
MAITSAICNSFKQEVLAMTPHTAADTYKIALIKNGHSGTYGAGTLNAGTPGTGAPTTSNLGTDECPASGTYAAGGITLATFAVSLDTNTVILDFADPTAPTGATLSADGAIIYNSSRTNKAVAVFSFAGAPISSTNGTFTITLPAATAAAGLIRWA